MRRVLGWLTLVVALGPACSDVNRLAQPDDVMTLVVSPDAIPADGFSTTIVTARISAASDERFRDVIFSTTSGSFEASLANDGRRVVVPADSGGVSTATLRAAPQVGTAMITAEIRDGDAVKVARNVQVSFEPLPSSEIISIEALARALPADGASVVDIVAHIAAGMPLAAREVFVHHDLGLFRAADAHIGSPGCGDEQHRPRQSQEPPRGGIRAGQSRHQRAGSGHDGRIRASPARRHCCKCVRQPSDESDLRD